MKESVRNRKSLKIAAHICRLTLAAVFICSGFLKSVDPWGTALKVNEYLSIYGLEELYPMSMSFSIWLCGAELMMGCMLLFKVRIRLISIFAMVSMTFFTVLTFLSATWLPVEDCGCFGEAVKLSPWASFAKNAVMLPLAVVVWWRYRPDKIFAFSRREILLTVTFFTIGMGVGTYCYLHLPLIDYLPYKIGVNIGEEMRRSQEGGVSDVVVVCRNIRTKKIREFELKDTEWQDDKKWEWIETRTVDYEEDVKIEALIDEFAVRDAEGDATDEIVNAEGRLYILCVTHLDRLGSKCERRMGDLVVRAASEGAAVVCLTPDYLDGVTYHSFNGGAPVRCLNIDATVMKTMLRARNGVVVLDDGTIVDKRNCRDIGR
ncbi:MAG: DoxX protein [Alistipes sp.]|nr:DoxX protein [Alistipes sp.]